MAMKGRSLMSSKYQLNVVVIHWQGIIDDMATLSNIDIYSDDLNAHSGEELAKRYSKDVDLDYYVRKYASKAKAIHPP